MEISHKYWYWCSHPNDIWQFLYANMQMKNCPIKHKIEIAKKWVTFIFASVLSSIFELCKVLYTIRFRFEWISKWYITGIRYIYIYIPLGSGPWLCNSCSEKKTNKYNCVSSWCVKTVSGIKFDSFSIVSDTLLKSSIFSLLCFIYFNRFGILF